MPFDSFFLLQYVVIAAGLWTKYVLVLLCFRDESLACEKCYCIRAGRRVERERCSSPLLSVKEQEVSHPSFSSQRYWFFARDLISGKHKGLRKAQKTPRWIIFEFAPWFSHIFRHITQILCHPQTREKFLSVTGFFFILSFLFLNGVPEKMYCMGNNNNPSDLSTEGGGKSVKFRTERVFPPSPNSQSVSSVGGN